MAEDHALPFYPTIRKCRDSFNGLDAVDHVSRKSYDALRSAAEALREENERLRADLERVQFERQRDVLSRHDALDEMVRLRSSLASARADALEEAATLASKHACPDDCSYYNIWGRACLSVANALRAAALKHEG